MVQVSFADAFRLRHTTERLAELPDGLVGMVSWADQSDQFSSSVEELSRGACNVLSISV